MNLEQEIIRKLQDLTALSEEVCNAYLTKHQFDLNVAIQSMIIDGIVDLNSQVKVEQKVLLGKSQVYGLIEFMGQMLINQLEENLEQTNEVAIVATMSSGKSTLMNAFLGQRLMPSKNEACTAKIISIQHDGTKKEFVDFNNQVIDLKKLQELNQGSAQTQISLKGPISSFSDISQFKLIDTPGPNNSQDASHKKVTYDFIKSEEKPLILLILDGTKLLTDDEAEFLQVIARESAKDSSKKIDEDRFIFVVNKSDRFRRDDDDIEIIKHNICSTLKRFNIQNPKIHFISAHNALLSRLSLNNQYMTEDDEDELDLMMRKVKRGACTFYQYSDLSPNVKKTLEDEINKASEEKDLESLVLLTSGVAGLELAIKEYIRKYKNIRVVNKVVEQCQSQIEKCHSFYELKNNIQNKQSELETLEVKLNQFNDVVSNGKKIKELQNDINNIKFENGNLDIIRREIIEELGIFIKNVQQLETKEINGKTMVSKAKANSYMTQLQEKYDHLRADLMSEFQRGLQQDVYRVIEKTVSSYRRYMADLLEEVNISKEIPLGNVLVNSAPNFITLSENKVIKEVRHYQVWIDNPDKQGWRKLLFWRPDEILVNRTEQFTGIELFELQKFSQQALKEMLDLHEILANEKEKAKQVCLNEVKNSIDSINAEIKNSITQLKAMMKEIKSGKGAVKNLEKQYQQKEKNVEMIKQKLDQIVAISKGV